MDAEWIDRCLLRNPSRCESVGHPVLYELAYPEDINARRRSGDRCLSHLFRQVLLWVPRLWHYYSLFPCFI